MTTVHIAASREYDVTIERGLIDRIGEESIKLLHPGKAVVISGELVFPLYGERVIASLKRAGFEVLSFIHETGENAKSIETYGKLLNFLCDNRVSSTDCLFALGGGVTGDLCGFAAATYVRGMSFIQIPTTLLAAVDSSVGGKTAINLNAAKNQAGCFYQPLAVFCDPDTLSTLSEDIYRCGCAETIKYGILGDATLFAQLEEMHIRHQEEQVIARCVEMKSEIVNQDEFDKGLRRVLNLGHTFGHAVEKCSAFVIPHGFAVSIGTAIMMRAAAKKGYCSLTDRDRVLSLLRSYGLPTETEYSAEELFDASCSDKKIASGKMHLVIPKAIGTVVVETISIDDMLLWLKAGV